MFAIHNNRPIYDELMSNIESLAGNSFTPQPLPLPQERIQTKIDELIDSLGENGYEYYSAALQEHPNRKSRSVLHNCQIDKEDICNIFDSLLIELKDVILHTLDQSSSFTSTPTSTSSYLHPPGFANFGNTCWLNVLLRKTYYTIPFKEAILKYPCKSVPDLAHKIAQKLYPEHVGDNSDINPTMLAQGLIQLQKLFVVMETHAHPVIYPREFVDALGLRTDRDECIREVWRHLFTFYSEFLEIHHCFEYTIRRSIQEIVPEGSLRPPRESQPRDEKHADIDVPISDAGKIQ